MTWQRHRSRLTECEKCRAELMMVRHVKTRKLAPIEVQPSDDGNILVSGDTYEILAKEHRARARAGGFLLRKNHFATCAYAKSLSEAEQSKPLPANVVRFPVRRRG